MPAEGTPGFQKLLEETGGASGLPGFNYEAHLAATSNIPAKEVQEDPIPISNLQQGISSSNSNKQADSTVELLGNQEEDRLLNQDQVAVTKTNGNTDGLLVKSSSPLIDKTAQSMPLVGTDEYQKLLEETAGASGLPGFNYQAHLAATQSNPVTQGENLKAPIDDTSSRMPLIGTVEYQKLLEETGGASGLPDFNYESHIQAMHLSDVNIDSNNEVLLTAPPKKMPPKGSFEYELLLLETKGSSEQKGFDYSSYIASRVSDPDSKPVERDIDWGKVDWSSIEWNKRRNSKTIDWGEIEWNEINWEGDNSDANNIDWSTVEWEEFQWEDNEYISGLDWGNVDWGDANYKNIKVEAIEFSELDQSDLKTISMKAKGYTIGANKDDDLEGGKKDETLLGALGNDVIDGKAGDDIIIGASLEKGGGKGEVDKLIGGKGNDTFVLASEFGVLYDNNSKSPGNKDFARIMDFNAEEDLLRLYGEKRNYFLKSANKQQRLLFFDSNMNGRYSRRDELIAKFDSIDGSLGDILNDAIYLI